MLSSNSSCNHNPSPNYRPFPENDISSTPKLEDHTYSSSSFSFGFPSSPHTHLEYQDVYLQFLELFYHQEHQPPITTTAVDADSQTPAAKMTADSNENAQVAVAAAAAAAADADADADGKAKISKLVDRHVKNRCSKKDRHSKINTARGPRDRRMRLSLDIARKFFDLQDLLGYDKASRTVEWLLRNSSPAIRELARGRRHQGGGGLTVGADHHNNNNNNNNHVINPSSESSATNCEEDCEVVSSTIEEEEAPSVPSSCSKSRRTTRSKKVKRVVGRATVARESRKKARERARERTSQKRRLINETSSTAQEQKLYGESLVQNHSFKESQVAVYDMQQQQQQEQEVGAAGGQMVEDLRSDEARILGPADHHQLGCTLPWNPSTVFDYHEDHINAVFLHQDEQIAQFQFSGKAWEAFNSFSLLSG